MGEMELLIINGPNINMLGIREPEIYGIDTYDDLIEYTKAHVKAINKDHRDPEKSGPLWRNNPVLELVFYQSNHEGDIIDAIQEAYFERVDGIILNPGAYAHTSIAIADAVAAINVPTVEVHLSDINTREPFRHNSFLREHCIATVSGRGIFGYADAVDILYKHLTEKKNESLCTEKKLTETKDKSTDTEDKSSKADDKLIETNTKYTYEKDYTDKIE